MLVLRLGIAPPSRVLLYLHHLRLLVFGRIVTIMSGKHNRSASPVPCPNGMIPFSLPTAKPPLAQDRFQGTNRLHTSPHFRNTILNRSTATNPIASQSNGMVVTRLAPMICIRMFGFLTFFSLLCIEQRDDLLILRFRACIVSPVTRGDTPFWMRTACEIAPVS